MTNEGTAAPAETLLRSGNFRKFWAGQGLGQFGAQMGHVALPVVAIELLRASEIEVGILNAAAMAAFLLVGLPAGAWVDRWLKRRTMIRADVVRCLAALSIPLLWFTDSLAMWHLYVVAAVIGVATVFFDVAYQSYIPILVRPDQVPDANSKLEGTAQVARIGGPALAGLLLKFLSAPVLIIADAVGYLASVLFLRQVTDREIARDPATHGSLRSDIAEGIRFVWHHDLIRRITACTAGSNFFGSLLMTLSPLFILRTLGFEPFVFGLVLAAGSVGGIVGAVATPWLARRIGEGTVIPVAAVAAGIGIAALPLAVLAPTRPLQVAVLIAGEFVFSFFVLAYNIMQVSMRQRVCPERLLGRMNASIRFVVWGVMPISALLAGFLGAWIGVVATMWVGVAGMLLAALPVVFSPLRGMATLPSSPDPDPSPSESPGSQVDPGVPGDDPVAR